MATVIVGSHGEWEVGDELRVESLLHVQQDIARCEISWVDVTTLT